METALQCAAACQGESRGNINPDILVFLPARGQGRPLIQSRVSHPGTGKAGDQRMGLDRHIENIQHKDLVIFIFIRDELVRRGKVKSSNTFIQ